VILPTPTHCACGAPDLVAVDPGDAPEYAAIGALRVVTGQGRPARGWCAGCWMVGSHEIKPAA